MTFDPVSMTMSSVECPTLYRPKAIVVDRLKQRFHTIERHSQKCKDRHSNTQSILRAKERSETALLLQRVQEQKNKKVGKFKPDSSRPKANLDTSDSNDAAYQALTMSRLKRKLQMPDPNEKQTGYGENNNAIHQQETKKVKHDDNNKSNQRQSDYQIPNVSVQIVQKFGNETAKRIETTVNVQSTMQDSQSVSVNVGSKNIKQEMVNEVQHMNQGSMNQRVLPSDVNCGDSTDFSGLLGDLESEFDMNLLDEWTNAMTEDDVDELHRVFLTSDSQMASQTQQQMTSQAQQMTSASHHMSSGQHLAAQQNIIQQQQQQSNAQMQQQQRQQHPSNAQMLCKSEKVDMFHGFHGNNIDSKKDNPPPTRIQRNMTQQNISANIMTQQSMRSNMGPGNFGSNHSSQQNISLNMSSSNNFSLRNQQNISANISSNNMTTNNNNNLTSQHIQRLNQLSVNSQFSHEAPVEPPRLFHPPAAQMSQSQAGYYESHSQQLKQLAEKRWGINGSTSVNMTSEMRAPQTFTQYHSNEIPPMSQPLNMPNHPMSSVPGTQRLSHLDPNVYSRPSQQFMQNQQRSGSMMMQQSMSSQMQHEAMMKQRNLQYQQIQQSNQNNYYNRIPESQHQQMSSNSQAMSFQTDGLPSWNTHGSSWPATSQIPPPMARMQPPTPELSHGSYNISDINVDLNILDEILKVQS